MFVVPTVNLAWFLCCWLRSKNKVKTLFEISSWCVWTCLTQKVLLKQSHEYQNQFISHGKYKQNPKENGKHRWTKEFQESCSLKWTFTQVNIDYFQSEAAGKQRSNTLCFLLHFCAGERSVKTDIIYNPCKLHSSWWETEKSVMKVGVTFFLFLILEIAVNCYKVTLLQNNEAVKYWMIK